MCILSTATPMAGLTEFQTSMWGLSSHIAVIIISAIIRSGVFVLAVIPQKHNIFSPQP